MSMLFPTLPDGLFFKLDQEGGNLFLDVMGRSGGGRGTPTPDPAPACCCSEPSPSRSAARGFENERR